MNRFQWMNPKTVAEAAAQTNSTVADAMLVATRSADSKQGTTEGGRQPDNTTIIKAGGIDLLDLLKEGLVTPSGVINIRVLPNMDRIVNDRTGLRIGPLVTLTQIAADKSLQRSHTALVDAASHVATPQIRNVATIGGNLLQRPKCWYFRHEVFQCLKKGGDHCFALEGDNEFHAIFDNQACPIVHPSTMATPLVAMNASLVLTNQRGGTRTVQLEEFFISPEKDVRRENTLQTGEIVTEIRVPPMSANTRSAHIKQGEKESFDWALADVAVVLKQEGAKVSHASIVLGAAAPVPWRARSAEAALVGKPVTEETARVAAQAAIQGAKPLQENGHKVPIFEAVVRRTILLAASNTSG